MAVATVLGSAGCGDNSRLCGPGTIERAGVCEADVVPPACTDGTVLDPETNTCVIDPAVCQDGTVLVGGECKDPGHLTVDTEEAAEPNGLGFLESSAEPAGTPAIKPIGETTVIHGTIVPFQDADGDGQLDPDVDTYVVTVNAPTLVTVSADGLHGLVGGFFAAALIEGPMADWVRLGVALEGDTAKRQIYLPVAGTYALVVADTRTVLTGAAVGNDPSSTLDFEYYLSIGQETIAPTALTVTGRLASTSGTLAPGDVQLFTVPMGLGVNTAVLETPADDFTGSVVVATARGGVTLAKGVADEDDGVARRSMLGFRETDTTTVVADHVIAFTNAPVAFDLTVHVGVASPLSTNGGSAIQTNFGDVAGTAGTLDDQNLDLVQVFFYDVAAANEIAGIDLAFNVPVTGVLVDESFQILANFTFDPTVDPDVCGGVCGFAFEDTFAGYVGHLRHPAAGRYYFLVFDAGGADIIATSRIAPVVPGTIVKDTVTATQTVSTLFDSNVFTYDAGTTVAWQQFNAFGTGTGAFAISYFDPATAFGRLDPVTTTCGAICDDRAPVFATTHTENGLSPRGRIVIDDLAAMGASTYLVTVKTANGTGTFDLNFNSRPHTDIGAKALGEIDDRAGQVLENTIAGTILVQRYLVRTATNHRVNVRVQSSGTLNAQIQHVNRDESPRGAPVDNAGLNGIDDGTFLQRGDGWTAWTVTASGVQATDATFSQEMTILGPQ